MGIFSKKPRDGKVYRRGEALDIIYRYGASNNFTFIPVNVNGETCYRFATLKKAQMIMDKLKDERNSIKRRNEFIEGIKEKNTSREYNKPNPGFKSYGNYGDYDISR